ncbi:MAG: phage holin family protein [Gemmatimonadales bacterium]|nr:phage holin family protein [Gemmatimonadales bacterium]MDZ4391152.1 phage holin family protein [Gemmatimonadales bacterium]
MSRLMIRILITACALWVAVEMVDGISHTGSIGGLVGVALVFGVVNAILKPLLTMLTCPLIMLTLGLFTFVLNAVLLLVTASLSQALGLGFAVDGFWAAFWGGLIVGITSTVLGLLTPPTTPAKR